MNIQYHRDFEKDYCKLDKKKRKRWLQRLEIFMANPFSVELNNHPLHGIYDGYRSINISGDLRAIYKLVSEDMAEFIALDTHSQLYK